jgi:N-acetylmuramic acid 6-phosphate (MurNAc-6-P) etherase
MAKQKNRTGNSGRSGFVIGAAGFAKISGVEGIRLKTATKKRAAEAASKGLSAEETRKAIIGSYRKA